MMNDFALLSSSRTAPAIKRGNLVRVRRGRITIEIHLSGELRAEQVDEVFASLARHLGESS